MAGFTEQLDGRDAVRQWIDRHCGAYPVEHMVDFPMPWTVLDEEKGWVMAQVWNRMVDPGDGSLHQAYNFTLLKYAGSGQWSYEEDIYNPTHFQTMIRGWKKVRKTCEQKS